MSHLSTLFVLQGNTAVYLLYAHARICSIIRKAGKDIEELKKVTFLISLMMILQLLKQLIAFCLIMSIKHSSIMIVIWLSDVFVFILV